MAEPIVRVKYSERLEKLLKKLEDADNYVAFELLWLGESDSKYHNGLKIDDVDVSKTDYCFNVSIGGKKHDMKIGKFIRYFFPGILSDKEISEFSNTFTKVKNGQSATAGGGKKIEVKPFSYNPKDVRSTFLSLVTKTYPHFTDCRHEKEVLQFLPKLEEDGLGNYYKIIGDSKPSTMFTSHLDTADREQKTTNLYSKTEGGDEIIYTDGSTILGADDKSGVAIMLYMMDHNIPGLYYFFIGEERGGIGSNRVSADYERFDYLQNIKRCVSFDRRSTGSVITQQMYRQCCSNEFGTALCNEYNANGLNLSLDPTGIYTDSASFIDDIPECTNISVGYMNEHTGREFQNMTFLIKVAEASVKVDWSSLPTVRKVGVNDEIIRKHKNLITELKKSAFALEVKVIGFEGRVYVRVDLDEIDIDAIYDSLTDVHTILSKHKVEPEVTFSETYIKIELK
jgi:hypothetical protein